MAIQNFLLAKLREEFPCSRLPINDGIVAFGMALESARVRANDPGSVRDSRRLSSHRFPDFANGIVERVDSRIMQ